MDKVFYVVERDRGGWTNKHVHMLVETRTALGNIAVGDYQLIDNPKAVTNYVTKWIDYDCEYNLMMKS